MDEILRSYIEDLRDSLLLFNEALMLLDSGVTDDETINRIFRVAHTIKGNSAAMEFMKVEKVMHTMEDILHEVREHKRELTPDIISIQYKCHDFLEDFMEVLLNDSSDENLETGDLLSALVAIKDGNQPSPAAEAAPTVEAAGARHDGLIDRIPDEILEVMEKNMSMGMQAYEINIQFTENADMKAVRTFMLFQKVEALSMLVYSEPDNPSEDDFRSGTFDFDGDTLHMVVLSEHELESLEAELNEDVNIEFAECIHLSAEDLKGAGNAREILRAINDIEVNVLDMQRSEINKDAVLHITQKLKEICNVDNVNRELLENIAQRMTTILDNIAGENRAFGADHIQTFALLLQSMGKIADMTTPLSDSDVIDTIEEYIQLLEDEFLIPEELVGEILKRKGLLNDQDVEDIASKQKESDTPLKFGQVAVQQKKVSAVEMSKVLQEQHKAPSRKKSSGSSEAVSQIRVPVTKVDNLMDMLGELIILNSQLEQQIESSGHAETGILTTISRAAKIIRSVQDLSMSLRLIQIKNTLFRLTRVIRDTATELGKQVNISIIGEDTEIDRSAAEKLFDPMMHLVRNAVSHGIETPDERIAAGKSPEGHVEIRAYSKRGHVYIEVNDDGKGIDPEKVLAKAIKVGLANENTDYTEAEIIRFIMQPGFSTQVEVNNISGRGVGMNVVESELMKIGGKVDIMSEKGKGSSFILRIPMNLALVNGTIVDISGERYIIPTLFIKQFFIQEQKDWLSMQGKKRAIKMRENIIPIITEAEIFQRPVNPDVHRQQIIVLEMEQKLLALPVDNIIGRQEIVSKPLSGEISTGGMLAGASILGDGQVSLILDVEALFKLSGQ